MWIFSNGKLLNNLLRMSFYAVAQGRKVGIFTNWNDCQQQISGFSKAVFKKFKTKSEAEKFIVEKGAGLDYLKVQTETTNFTKKIPDKLPDIKPKTKPNVNSEYDQEDEDLKSFIANELKVIEQEEQAEKARSSKAPQSSRRKSNKRRPSSPVASTSKKSAYSIPYIPPKSTHPKSYGQYEFQEDEHGFVHVYTDGSCINNGQKNPSAGLGVYFGEDHPLNASQPVKGRPTNNVGEIQASILAIRLASKHGIEKLMLLTDSQFLIHSICVWLPGWKRKGWKLATGENVKNRAEFEELDNLIERTDMCIKWHYVKAHSGIHGNERADQLAKEGQKLFKTC